MPTDINSLKRQILTAAHHAGEGHIASAFSILDIIHALYASVLLHDAMMPNYPGRDYFILSKGHGCLALYAVLANKGYFPVSWLMEFCRNHLGGHPHHREVPGVEASTGSLGHGLPIAVGIAMSLKYENKPNRVFCLIGDGELNEGSVWEALLLAAHHHLNNLTIIVDYNHSGDRALSLEPLRDKLCSFAYTEVRQICGHTHNDIVQACAASDKTVIVIANTIKGYGVKEMENNPAWHHRAPTKEELDRFTQELS